MELQRAQAVRHATQERVIELSAALRRTEQELEQLRRRYANLYLESRRQQQQFERVELRISSLLSDYETSPSERALSRVLEALQGLRKTQLELDDDVRRFGSYLNSVLDILEPSDVLRREVTARFADLTAAVENTTRPPPLVARRGGGESGRLECRVLTVKDDLQIVVLNHGQLDGVRLGTHWHVVRDNENAARLRVIEVRPTISAAMVVEGRLRKIEPGALVRSAK